MELAFFIAAHMVLWFGFVTKTVLVTYQSFSYCGTVLAQHQGFLCSSLCPPGSRLGLGKMLGGNTAKTADSNYPKGYSTPYNITLSNKTWKDQFSNGYFPN